MDGYCIPRNYLHIFLFMKVSRKYCVNFYKVYVAANSIVDGKAGYSVFPGISGTLHLTKNYIRLQILLKLAVITIDLTEKDSFWKKTIIVYDKEMKIKKLKIDKIEILKIRVVFQFVISLILESS